MIRVLSEHRSRSEVFIYHLWTPAVRRAREQPERLNERRRIQQVGRLEGVNKQTQGCLTPTCSSDCSSSDPDGGQRTFRLLEVG